MAKIDELKSKLNDALNDKCKPWSQILTFAEQKTNLPRMYLFGGKFLFIFL